MNPDIAEAVGKFTEMDRRLLVVKSLTRCVWLLWVPVVGIVAMMVALAWYADGWVVAVWSVLGCASGYFVVTVGEELCKLAMKLLQLNLDECKAMGGKESE